MVTPNTFFCTSTFFVSIVLLASMYVCIHTYLVIISPIFVASIDYEAPATVQLAFSSSSSASVSFDVTISPDERIECREFFEVIIKGFLVRRNVGGTQQSLTEQEKNRIVISPDRTRVFITGDNICNNVNTMLKIL